MSAEDLYWERTAYYGFFAERYGWTKDQVDSQPHWLVARLPGFAGIVDELGNERAKKAT